MTSDDEADPAPDLRSVLAALKDFDTDELLVVQKALSDRLVDSSFVELDDEQVVDAAVRLQRQTRRDEAVQVALTTQMLERGLPAKRGLRRNGFLREVLGLSGSEAVARVANTEHCAPLVGLTGDTLPPYAPTMATLLREGLIGTAHVRVMRSVIAKFPTAVRDDRPVWEAAEQQLGELAAMLDPDQLTRAAQRLLAYLDPDGVDDDDRDRKRRRSLTVGRQGVDHMSGIRGELDPVTRALWDVLAEKWARPGINNPDDPDSPTGDADKVDPKVVAAAAKRDTRSTAQRNHDAFTLMLRTITESGVLGQHRGLPAQVIVTMTLEELEAETGIATTASGGTLPVRDALTLAGTTRPFLALLDDKDRPLFLGRQRRLASADQRMALIASQRGCTRPGCDQPATRAAVHHVQEWKNGGLTDIDVLALACDADHAQVNDSEHGWITEIITPDTGPPDLVGRVGWKQRGTDQPLQANPVLRQDRTITARATANRHQLALETGQARTAQRFRDTLRDQLTLTRADGRRWEHDLHLIPLGEPPHDQRAAEKPTS
ncbi:HNH endonuclease signature motif containing protein [Williamsia sterculiae]|uniref:HNH endonuclease signature motif containing protein n=1 Tax=Williamsia sterculiae TaxID=1344003 RepID=UPI0009703996|nr:HNH endonuclease signature motif containing protein [Williamsia sterculiae]